MPSMYKQVGVLSADEMPAFGSALDILRTTFDYPRRGKPAIPFGYYASVLDLGGNVGFAVSTDGVGTKLLVAEELGKFDTVGIDCVAMNANDVVCVGAEPLAMVDYVAVEFAGGGLLRELAVGLRSGALEAGISIPGGETAQVPDMLHRTVSGNAFDLVGTCVGVVSMDRIVIGADIEPGDRVVGYAASGIHSNGLTLARQVLLGTAGLTLGSHVAELGRTLGEELLEPSRIYVRLALDLLETCPVHALAHVTSDGFLNLRRVAAPVGFDIEFVPEPPPIFNLIKQLGEVENMEMYSVYNMGVGFCVVVPPRFEDAAVSLGKRHGFDAWVLGEAVPSPERRVRILPVGLEGTSSHFRDSRTLALK